jgi:hypothetical protein
MLAAFRKAVAQLAKTDFGISGANRLEEWAQGRFIDVAWQTAPRVGNWFDDLSASYGDC